MAVGALSSSVYHEITYSSAYGYFVVTSRQPDDVDTTTSQTLHNKTLASPKLFVSTTAGTPNDFTVSIGYISSYSAGQQFAIKFNNASTGAITLNVNSLGARPVIDYLGNPVTNIRKNQLVILTYDNMSASFVLQANTTAPASTVADMNLYVDATTGSDTIGDGTQAKPYATITKAISMIPQVVNHLAPVS